MKAFHTLSLSGQVAKEPETKKVNDNTVTSVVLPMTAGNNTSKDADTIWVNVSCWNKLGEFVLENVGKNTTIFVSGTLGKPYVSQAGNVTLYLRPSEFKILDGWKESGESYDDSYGDDWEAPF